VFYVCPHHGENPEETDIQWIADNTGKHRWYERSKPEAMNRGEWVAHAEPEVPNHISTHLSTLYSNFTNWLEICYLHRKQCVLEPEYEQEFTNMVLGLPYEPKGTRPDITKINVLRDETYRMREVPEGVLYLTAAVDVQRGSKGEKKKINPARLEVQILGICNDYSVKMIDYLQVLGETDSVDSGAWKDFDELYNSDHFSYGRRRDGLVFEPVFWLFDAKDWARTDIVYKYCALQGNLMMYPSMGESYVAKEHRDNEKTLDKSTAKSYLPWKKREDKQTGITVYHISTVHYKKNIYRNIEKTISRAGESVPHIGKMYFPKDTPDKYFDMLMAEEMRPDGSFDDRGRRNESLDTMVYCMAGADIWLTLYRESLKIKAKGAGQKDFTYIDYQWCKDRIAIQSDQQWVDETFIKSHNAIARRI
jgi:phage terminase large subunit GpA-like protein